MLGFHSLICVAVTDIRTTGFGSYKKAPFEPIQNAILDLSQMCLLPSLILYIISYLPHTHILLDVEILTKLYKYQEPHPLL